MSWTVSWEPTALNGAAGFLQDTPEEVHSLLEMVEGLQHNAAPVGSVPYGPEHRRLRIGRWRVLYRIDSANATVHVEHVGRSEQG